MTEAPQSHFEKIAAEQNQPTLLSEFWSFLAHNRKWWLLPIVMIMLLLAVLLLISGSAGAPFIYTLF